MQRSIGLPTAGLLAACAFVIGIAAGMAGEFVVLTRSAPRPGQADAATLRLTASPVPTLTAERVRADVLRLVNQQRQQRGLAALKENPLLDRSAELKANDMIAKNYWSHTSPAGESPWHFFDVAGYSYTLAGENLAEGFDTPAGIVDGWMNSPTHRANVLAPGYAETGVAVIDGSFHGKAQNTLVVQHFGTPLILPSTHSRTPKT